MITINGDPSDIGEGLTITELLRARNFLFPLLIIKINGDYVPRESWPDRRVPAGARVDIIHLISGG
jgi:sulfur carrier protein